MSREFKIGDDVEWVRYGGLFGIDGFRCNGTIVGFGLIGEYLWCTVYCKNDKELYRIEAERLSIKENN